MEDNMALRIALGADHRGYALKEYLKSQRLLANMLIEWVDVGTMSTERTDYPIYAKMVAGLILNQQAELGILLCGTGTGMAIAANRFRGIYAGVAWNNDIARLNREDDNVNVLILPANYLTEPEAYELVISWFTAKFKEGRYADRIAMVDEFRSND